MSQNAGSRHRFGEFVFLGALVLITLVVYNLAAWSKSNKTEQPAVPMAEMAMPSDYDGFVRMGNDFMDRGLWDHAIRQYEEALALDDSQADVYVDLGACYHAIGDYQTALEELNTALQRDPKHQIAWFNIGVVQLSLADTTAAKESWGKFLEVAGDVPQAEMVRQQLEKM